MFNLDLCQDSTRSSMNKMENNYSTLYLFVVREIRIYKCKLIHLFGIWVIDVNIYRSRPRPTTQKKCHEIFTGLSRVSRDLSLHRHNICANGRFFSYNKKTLIPPKKLNFNERLKFCLTFFYILLIFQKLGRLGPDY